MACSTCLAPARSLMSAGLTTTRKRLPSVSTSMCHLRPSTFFSPVEPALAAGFGRLDALAIQHAGTRARLPADPLPGAFPQSIVDPYERAVRVPEVKVVPDGLPRPERGRHVLPRTAGPRHVED